MTTRRHFLMLLTALAVAPSCALRGRSSSQRTLASISGYVFGHGLRFGARPMKGLAIPGEPVYLAKICDEHEGHRYITMPTHDRGHWTQLVDKTFTNEDGHYSFAGLPGGDYIVWTVGGYHKVVQVTLPQDYNATFVRHTFSH